MYKSNILLYVGVPAPIPETPLISHVIGTLRQQLKQAVICFPILPETKQGCKNICHTDNISIELYNQPSFNLSSISMIKMAKVYVLIEHLKLSEVTPPPPQQATLKLCPTLP